MKIVLLSKAMVVGPYQKKLEELAKLPNVDLTLVVPPVWNEPHGVGPQRFDPQHTTGYEVVIAPMQFNGKFHYHYYPTIGRILRDRRPDVFHIDEEPYNFATYHAMQAGKKVGARMCFFTWQNIFKRYPAPFAQMERAVYEGVHAAVAGNREAMEILRAKGFAKPTVVIPQMGFDPLLYQPPPPQPRPVGRPPTVGYIGRLVEEKGVQVLLEAVALLKEPYRVEIIGTGYYRTELEVQAARLGIRDRIFFRNSVPSREVPDVLSRLDMLVIPSLTRSNWKEQFGRVIVEAMACEIPVIGSDSGEIPNVIGDAGIITPEGDAQTLALRIHELLEDRVQRLEYAARGRQRFLRHFTQEQVAHRYYQMYLAMVYGNVPYEPPPPVSVAPRLPEMQNPAPAAQSRRPRAASSPASATPARPFPVPEIASVREDEDEPDYPPGYGNAAQYDELPPDDPAWAEYIEYEEYADDDDEPPEPQVKTVPDWWLRR